MNNTAEAKRIMQNQKNELLYQQYKLEAMRHVVKQNLTAEQKKNILSKLQLMESHLYYEQGSFQPRTAWEVKQYDLWEKVMAHPMDVADVLLDYAT